MAGQGYSKYGAKVSGIFQICPEKFSGLLIWKKGERAFVQEKPVANEEPPSDKGSKGWSFIAE